MCVRIRRCYVGDVLCRAYKIVYIELGWGMAAQVCMYVLLRLCSDVYTRDICM